MRAVTTLLGLVFYPSKPRSDRMRCRGFFVSPPERRRTERVPHSIRVRRSDRWGKVRARLFRFWRENRSAKLGPSARFFALVEIIAPIRLRETAKGIRGNVARGWESLVCVVRSVIPHRAWGV